MWEERHQGVHFTRWGVEGYLGSSFDRARRYSSLNRLYVDSSRFTMKRNTT